MCLNVKYTTYLQRMLKEKTIKECLGTHLKTQNCKNINR